MQETRVLPLVWEDVTCYLATNSCTAFTEPVLQSSGATTTHPSATTTEAEVHRRNHHNGKHANHNEGQPPVTQLEKAHTQQRRFSTAKDKQINNCFKENNDVEFFKINERQQTTTSK